MLAYKQNITVTDPKHLVLDGLPLKAGQQIEVLILVKEETNVTNPATDYTNDEWDKLTADERSELETQYVLNNPILMKQIQKQDEWINVSIEQLDTKN